MNTPDPMDPRDGALDALFANARTARPDTSRAEYGFATRLMARIAAERREAAGFSTWVWRLLPGLAVVTIALSWSTWRTYEETFDAGPMTAAVPGQAFPDGDDDAAQWADVFSPI